MADLQLGELQGQRFNSSPEMVEGSVPRILHGAARSFPCGDASDDVSGVRLRPIFLQPYIPAWLVVDEGVCLKARA